MNTKPTNKAQAPQKNQNQKGKNGGVDQSKEPKHQADPQSVQNRGKGGHVIIKNLYDSPFRVQWPPVSPHDLSLIFQKLARFVAYCCIIHII